MQSWIIGKMILTTWKNRWWQMTKRSPMVGIIPLLLVLGIIASAWYVYDSTHETFFSGNESDEIIATLLLQRMSLVTFLLIAMVMGLFWQWGIRSGLNNRFLETLPVHRSAWIGGQLLPISFLMLLLILAVFLPILLVFLDALSLPFHQQLGAILLYAIVLGCALLIGVIWQQVIHLLVGWVAKGRSASVQRFFHGAFFLSSVFACVSWGVWNLKRGWDIWFTPLPGALFSKTVLNWAKESEAWLTYVGLLLVWLVGLLVLVVLLFYLDSKQQTDNTSKQVLLSSLSFPRLQLFNVASLECRRVFRDAETHFNIIVSLFFLALIGGILRLVNWELYLPLYRTILFFGLPFLLSIYPLISRGRDISVRNGFRLLPLPTHTYVAGKMLPYLTVLPLIAWLLLIALQALVATPFPSLTKSFSFFIQAVLFWVTGFVVGTALPSDESKFTGKWIVNLVFVGVCLPLFYGTSVLQTHWPTELYIATVLVYIVVSYLIAFLLERGREHA